MSESPCVDLKRKAETAQREYEEAREAARAAIIAEPLEPENEPQPALPGSKGTNPYKAEREARKRLEVAEKAYADCSGNRHQVKDA